MYLYLEPNNPRELLAVVRTGTGNSTPNTNPPLWSFNSTLDVLHLSNSTIAENKCLSNMQNGQYSNLAAGNCPSKSWRSDTADLPGYNIASLFHNSTDSTVRFVYRDSYALNKKNFTACLTATWGEPCANAEFASLPFCDTAKSADVRADDLLARATVEELSDMLTNDNVKRPWVARLGFVPNNTQQEALHGADASGGKPALDQDKDHGTGFGTSFPHQIALAASLNKTLWTMVGSVIAIESRALANQGAGGLFLRTPNLNMARDPRWGRVQETAGEDPVLVSEYGVAVVAGVAGNGTTLMAAAAPKHFSCYSGPENWGGIYRWTFDAVVADKYLTSYFHPGFEATIKTGNVRGPMCSYNSVNGVASCSNDFFNNQLMRKEWGLDGFVRCAFFRQKSTLEDAIGSHACSLHCSLESSRRVTNGISLGLPNSYLFTL
jgi:hypothetical protein